MLGIEAKAREAVVFLFHLKEFDCLSFDEVQLGMQLTNALPYSRCTAFKCKPL
jgi:hypothetical protein